MSTERETMNEKIASEGINEDYVWHAATSIRTKLKSVQSEFEEFVMVMAKRDKENRDVIKRLYDENFQMNQEIKDLKEKNDGRAT